MVSGAVTFSDVRNPLAANTGMLANSPATRSARAKRVSGPSWRVCGGPAVEPGTAAVNRQHHSRPRPFRPPPKHKPSPAPFRSMRAARSCNGARIDGIAGHNPRITTRMTASCRPNCGAGSVARSYERVTSPIRGNPWKPPFPQPTVSALPQLSPTSWPTFFARPTGFTARSCVERGRGEAERLTRQAAASAGAPGPTDRKPTP